LRIRDFRWFLSGNLLALLGTQMQTVAVGWEIYERTPSKLALAFVGLVQVIPVVSLLLPAGQASDRFDRRKIMMRAQLLLMACSLGLARISAIQGDVRLMYLCLLLIGVARAFQLPAKAAFVPQIVSRERFSNAVTWNSSGFQLACVLGPALGGGMIAVFNSAAVVYIVDAAMTLIFFLILSSIASRPVVPQTERVSLRSIVAGIEFVWANKIILAALTLDMFAVLLGGATMLLPVFAEDILHAGPAGLGWMRGAPGFGALGMSLILAYRPPVERAGRALLWSVAGFGVVTVIFGVSRTLWLSLAMLFLSGAFDMVSVVIRHTLVQLLTPDRMRGRVSAVNGVFIGLSNELGGFESGFVAYLFDRPGSPAFGPTLSVVAGGIGTLLVVASVAIRWPQVRRYGRLDSGPEEPE
jgi:MFS family permease